MTMLTSTIAWCTPCVERARRAHSFTLDVVSHLIWLKIWGLIICHPRSYPWRTLFDSLLPFYFYLSSLSLPSTSCTPSCTLSSTTRSSWKLVLLRQQGEWRRLGRLHLPHRLWAQLRDLRRAQRLIGSLLHYTVIHSFPVLLKYIDVSRTTHTNLDVKQERRIDDYWNIDVSRDSSDSWTGFTQLLLEKLQTDTCGPGEINEKTADIRARSLMAKSLGENVKECQADGKATVVEWKAPSG